MTRMQKGDLADGCEKANGCENSIGCESGISCEKGRCDWMQSITIHRSPKSLDANKNHFGM